MKEWQRGGGEGGGGIVVKELGPLLSQSVWSYDYDSQTQSVFYFVCWNFGVITTPTTSPPFMGFNWIRQLIIFQAKQYHRRMRVKDINTVQLLISFVGNAVFECKKMNTLKRGYTFGTKVVQDHLEFRKYTCEYFSRTFRMLWRVFFVPINCASRILDKLFRSHSSNLFRHMSIFVDINAI